MSSTTPIPRQEKNRLERVSRKLDPVAAERERDRLKKQRGRVDSAKDMRFVQALREFFGKSPLPGVPER